ncbi:Crp/Fnr family transcriptional regulator [Salegentibacter salarius]|uniref:HTH crp-type domain-containing protein n=1 Tax=Salegentibacter salarius TaxID=435906 RepID=A0A2N0U513_9FLAO|nr:Crp/Fnr family transcriptional regulator [Salegentibacter salarius]OEY73901.1 hypothetical protein BHS39_00295 [Salegentibacter salarius]PKD22101.1 hypothetical protein APR40_00295 [Salegentibacter salarius]SLJ86431.1 cAMP-binding domain of CRP or a regulatory subunit of cAMP-dependent protein kinases [Salegentibacter salarius]
MKYVVFFSEKDFSSFKLDKSSGLKDYNYAYINSLHNLRSFLNKKKPELIIWSHKTKISSEIFNNNPELYNTHLLSIISEDSIETWQPFHGKHHYLPESHSKAELLLKIDALLCLKNEKTFEGEKVDSALIPDIETLKNYIEEKGEQVTWDKNKIIFRENRHSSFIYLISNGLVKTSRMDQLGKELITGIYRNNELLGLYGFHKNPICPETATTIESSRVHRILYKDFKEILQKNPGLSLDLAQHLTDTVLRLKSQLLEMAYASVLKKTSNTILQFADDLQNPDFQGLKISRTDLASIAGISPESFIRSLSCLKKEGIISIKGKNINILNSEKLQHIT